MQYCYFFLYTTLSASDMREIKEQHEIAVSKQLIGVVCGTGCLVLGSIEALLRTIIFCSVEENYDCSSVMGNCFGSNGVDAFCISNYISCGGGCVACAVCALPSLCKDKCCTGPRGDYL